MELKLFTSLLLLACQVRMSVSVNCNQHGFYCLTSEIFQECIDHNTTSGVYNTCPEGTYCYTECVYPCLSQPCTTCNSAGYSCPGDTTFQLCDIDGRPQQGYNQCPSGTVCSENCNSPSVCTVESCPVTCGNTTRLPIPGDRTNYYLCVVRQDGSVVVQTLSCPGGSLFDPDRGMCTTSSTSTSVLTPSTTSTFASTSTLTSTSTSTSQPFQCPSVGRFTDPASCHRYYLCSYSPLTDSLRHYLYQCPNSLYFNPHSSKCSSDATVCSVESTTSTHAQSSPTLVVERS